MQNSSSCSWQQCAALLVGPHTKLIYGLETKETPASQARSLEHHFTHASRPCNGYKNSAELPSLSHRTSQWGLPARSLEPTPVGPCTMP